MILLIGQIFLWPDLIAIFLQHSPLLLVHSAFNDTIAPGEMQWKSGKALSFAPKPLVSGISARLCAGPHDAGSPVFPKQALFPFQAKKELAYCQLFSFGVIDSVSAQGL